MAGIKINTRRTIRRPDYNLHSQRLHDRGVALWNRAVGVFIQTVGEIVGSYQDTGMSLASLFPLARDARVKGKLPAISPKPINPESRWREKTYTDLQGIRHPGIMKSPALGEQLGEKAGNITYGTKDYVRFTFRFEIQVWQFLLNEYGMQVPPSIDVPKHSFNSLKAGEQAMLEYLNIHGSEIFPDMKEYFVLESSTGKSEVPF